MDFSHAYVAGHGHLTWKGICKQGRPRNAHLRSAISAIMASKLCHKQTSKMWCIESQKQGSVLRMTGSWVCWQGPIVERVRHADMEKRERKKTTQTVTINKFIVDICVVCFSVHGCMPFSTNDLLIWSTCQQLVMILFVHLHKGFISLSFLLQLFCISGCPANNVIPSLCPVALPIHLLSFCYWPSTLLLFMIFITTLSAICLSAACNMNGFFFYQCHAWILEFRS